MPAPAPVVSAAAMTRVQVLTPLSILVSAGTLIVTSILTRPRLNDVSEAHPTYLTPNAKWLMAYWSVIYLCQIGFALLCVVGQKPETKKLLASGVGVRLALVNFLLAGWAVSWIINTHVSFIVGTSLLGAITLVLLITAGLLAFWLPADSRHPLDWLFVHVPIKMLLVSMIAVDFGQQLFMALEWDGGKGHDLEASVWPTFYTLMGVGAFNSLWIFTFSDLTWAASGIVLNLALLAHPKIPRHARPAEVTAAIICSIALQGTALLGSYAHKYIAHQREQRRIRLGSEDDAAARLQEAEAEAAAARARADAYAAQQNGGRLPHAGEDEEQGGVGVTRHLGSSGSSA